VGFSLGGWAPNKPHTEHHPTNTYPNVGQGIKKAIQALCLLSGALQPLALGPASPVHGAVVSRSFDVVSQLAWLADLQYLAPGARIMSVRCSSTPRTYSQIQRPFEPSIEGRKKN